MGSTSRWVPLAAVVFAWSAGGCTGTTDAPMDMATDGPPGHIELPCTPDMPCMSYDKWNAPNWVPDANNFTDSLCEWFCDWVGEAGDTCASGLAKDTCPQKCAEMLQNGLVNNVACFAAKCSSVCLQMDAFPTPPECVQACANADQCKQMYALRLTPTVDGCTAMCSGLAVAYPGFAAALPCMAPALAACDITTAVNCIDDARAFCVWCDDGSCWGNPGTPFASTQACWDGCGLRGANDAFQVTQCFLQQGCSFDPACTDTPIIPACKAYGDKLMQACGRAAWPPTAEMAARVCTVDAFVYKLTPVSDDPPVCDCGRPGQPRPPACVFQTPQECNDACDAMTRCHLYDVNQRTQCEGDCIVRTQNQPSALQFVETCLQTTNCAKVAGCFDIPGEHQRTFCQRYCDLQKVCGSTTDDQVCQDMCNYALVQGDSTEVGLMACVGDGDCDRLQACLHEPIATMDPACLALCPDNLCHHIDMAGDNGLRACQITCSELLREIGRSGDQPTAQCLIDHFDHDCMPGAQCI
jgi:hypothetical protein